MHVVQRQKAQTLKSRGDKGDLFRPGTKGGREEGGAGGNGSQREEVGTRRCHKRRKRFFGGKLSGRAGKGEEARPAQEMCAV